MLVRALQRQGLGMNGVILLSSILDFSLDWDVNFNAAAIGGGDWAFPLYLPTEAASSWFHKALPGSQQSLTAFLSQVEDFSMHEYLSALAQGSNLSPSRFNDVVAKLHAYTGLSESYIRQSNLRVPYWRYETELFRNNGVMLGRLDARYTSYSLDRINERTPFDPADAAMDTAYVGRRQLLHAADPRLSHDADLPAAGQRFRAMGLEAQRRASGQYGSRSCRGDDLRSEAADFLG